MNKPYLVWKKAMEDKINYQNLLKEEAERVARIPGYKPRVKIGKKNIKLFENYIKESEQQEKRKNKRRRGRS